MGTFFLNVLGSFESKNETSKSGDEKKMEKT